MFQWKWRKMNFRSIHLNQGLPFLRKECPGNLVYTADAIDRMSEMGWHGHDKIVLLTHGAHFLAWDPIVFYNRLISIREAVVNYKRKYPDTIFIFKTMNFFRENFAQNWYITSPFPAYLQREMAFRVFGNPYLDDMRSDEFPVKVFDVYPMVLSAFEHMDPGNLHTPKMGFLTWHTSNMMLKLLEYVDYLK